jgi:serine/threonine-protein kinase
MRVLVQTCKALTKAHGMGVVHRDIKPDNLFLVDMDGEPFVKVLDFGIAKQTTLGVTDMTATNTMIGTPYYMSPEQALSSKNVDARADLWALAVLLYLSLTGTLPFDGETIGAICVAIDRAEFVPVSRLRPDLPAALDGWFSRAFARKIDRRFASAREMSEGFLQAVGEEAPASMLLSARSSLPSASGQLTASGQSRRWPVAIGVALGALILGLGAFALRGQGASATTGISHEPATSASAASPPPAASPALATSAPAATSVVPSPAGTPSPAATTTSAPAGKAARGGRGAGEVVIDDSAPRPTPVATAAATTAATPARTTPPTSTAAPPKEIDRGF